MKQLGFLLCAVLLAALPVLAQPEVAGDGGAQPREGKDRPAAAAAKTGTLTATGSGFVRIQLMRGTATIEGAGDLLVRGNVVVDIKGEAGAKTVVDEAAAMEFLGERAPKARENAVKDAPAEGPKRDEQARPKATIYKGFKGTITITIEKQGMLAVRGTDVKVTVNGVGQGMLIGDGAYTLALDGGNAQEGKWAVRPQEGVKPTEANRPKQLMIGEMPKRPAGDGEGQPKGGARDGEGKPQGDKAPRDKAPREGKGGDQAG